MQSSRRYSGDQSVHLIAESRYLSQRYLSDRHYRLLAVVWLSARHEYLRWTALRDRSHRLLRFNLKIYLSSRYFYPLIVFLALLNSRKCCGDR